LQKFATFFGNCKIFANMQKIMHPCKNLTYLQKLKTFAKIWHIFWKYDESTFWTFFHIIILLMKRHLIKKQKTQEIYCENQHHMVTPFFKFLIFSKPQQHPIKNL
jgi:hypothetical protein